jgi:hypothetical protein
MDYSGLILAVVIAALVAWIMQRYGKKMHFQVKGKHWLAILVIVVVLLFLFFGASHTPHGTVK